MRFKVGDIVKVRDYMDLLAEYGSDEFGNIKTPNPFLNSMLITCGHFYIVTKVVHIQTTPEVGGYYLKHVVDNEMCEPEYMYDDDVLESNAYVLGKYGYEPKEDKYEI